MNQKLNWKSIKDTSDNMLLELTDESCADFLITGNTNDFTISHYKNTLILSLHSFWENYTKPAN
jgi:predicted nucleic acid-binding protein